MSLKIFYDPALDDEGRYLGDGTLIIENREKYLSVTVTCGVFEVYHEPSNYEDILSLSDAESFNKINDLIKKVLE
jgi:hypothetical protein